MKLYSIGDFAEKFGEAEQNLRNWDESNKFKMCHVSDGGTGYCFQEKRNHFHGIDSTTKVVGYCRVSSHKQRDDLERQVDTIKENMIAKGYSLDVITDIGSDYIKELIENDSSKES